MMATLRRVAIAGGVDSQNEGGKNVENSNYETSPPSETSRNLADFQSRHGEAPRFAGADHNLNPARPQMVSQVRDEVKRLIQADIYVPIIPKTNPAENTFVRGVRKRSTRSSPCAAWAIARASSSPAGHTVAAR